MKRKIKKSNLLSFLAASGVLNSGDEALIQAKRKEYYRIVKRDFIKQKRSTCKSFTILLKPKEFQLIKLAASRHNNAVTTYLKNASMAYANKRYLATDRGTLLKVKELLQVVYFSLHRIYEYRFCSLSDITTLGRQLEAIQKCFEQQVTTPQSLESKVKDAIKINPEYKNVILHLIQNPSEDDY